MKKTFFTTLFVIIFGGSSCLADGRSEEEYLAAYSQFVDLGALAYSPVDGDRQSENFTIRRKATNACSTPQVPNVSLQIIQEIKPSIRVFKVDPENDCKQVYIFDLFKGTRSSVLAWEGAVYRFIDYDGVLIMEVEIGDMKSLELLVIE